MRTDRSRPFTLIDAMILIAAIAVGLGAGIAVDRLQVAGRPPALRPFPDDRPDAQPPPLQPPLEDQRPPLPSLPDAFPASEVADPLALPPLLPMPLPPSASDMLQVAVTEIVRSTAVFLACCTLGLLALRLRRPRPPIRRLALRPGSTVFVVVIFAAVVAGVAACSITTHYRDENWPTYMGSIIEEWIYLSNRSIGPHIVIIWTVLALGRRWSVRGWLEWSGLVLGALCALTYLADQFVFVWMKWA